MTLHRPALVDDPELLARDGRALVALAETTPTRLPGPSAHARAARRRSGSRSLERLLLDRARSATSTFLGLEAEARFVLTDSGGVQEETSALGVRCFTLRDSTERPVTVELGTNTVLGLEPERIAEIPALLAEPRAAGADPAVGRPGGRARGRGVCASSHAAQPASARLRCAASPARSRSPALPTSTASSSRACATRWRTAGRTAAAPGSPTTAASASASAGSRSSTSRRRRCSRWRTRTAALRLVFNGEIYNHAEIRAELEQLGGHVFRTDHSDTEMIVHAFEQWGIDCLHRFRGMFAFALWDARDAELWLVARPDRHQAALLRRPSRAARRSRRRSRRCSRIPQQARAVDEESLYHYLSFLTTPAPATLFRGIRKLPAGRWLRVDARRRRSASSAGGMRGTTSTPLDGVSRGRDRGARARGAAHVGPAAQGERRARSACSSPAASTRARTRRSSRRARRAGEDVLDRLRRATTRRIRTSCTARGGWPSDVGAEHHERMLSLDDLLEFLPEMVRLQDEPIADPVCVPLYYVSELARRQGRHRRAGRRRAPTSSSRAIRRGGRCCGCSRRTTCRCRACSSGSASRAAAARRPRTHARPYEYLRRGGAGLPVFWGGAEAFTEAQKRRLLSPRLRRELGGLTSWDALAPIRERFEETAWEPSHLNWMTYLDLRLRLPELLLDAHRQDEHGRVARGARAVPRPPASSSSRCRSRRGSKTARRRAEARAASSAVRGVIPDELIDRPKQGFRVPVEEWLLARARRPHARPRWRTIVRARPTCSTRARQRALLEKPGREAWYLLNLALWWKEVVAA